MKIAVFCALGLMVGILMFVALMSRVRYRIGSRHIKVILFGLVLRRVSLSNIESVSKRRAEGLAEHWWSTVRPKHRMLVLRRRKGLFRNFVITPKNRYIFKADLERAVDRAAGRVPSSQSLAQSVAREENCQAADAPSNAEPSSAAGLSQATPQD
jgi:hypothetical protein